MYNGKTNAIKLSLSQLNFLATPMDYTHFTHFQRGIWDPDKKL